mgnify:CR=1 FL=1
MKTYPDNTKNITFDNIQSEYPVYNRPQPTNANYINGYFVRYFVKKTNDSAIYEVLPDRYNNISNKFYQKISINWIISGKKDDEYSGKIQTYVGVKSANIASTNIADSSGMASWSGLGPPMVM